MGYSCKATITFSICFLLYFLYVRMLDINSVSVFFSLLSPFTAHPQLLTWSFLTFHLALWQRQTWLLKKVPFHPSGSTFGFSLTVVQWCAGFVLMWSTEKMDRGQIFTTIYVYTVPLIMLHWHHVQLAVAKQLATTNRPYLGLFQKVQSMSQLKMEAVYYAVTRYLAKEMV